MIPYHLLNLINNRKMHVLSLLCDVPFKSQTQERPKKPALVSNTNN